MSRTIFLTIAEIKEQISVDISSDIRTLQPYIKQAETRYLKEIIGTDLLELLRAAVNDEDAITPELEALLPVVRYPAAHFAYMLAVPQLSLNVGETGIGVTMSGNFEPAAEWRLKNFSISLENTGYDGVEELLEFLETYVADYPEWVLSPAYSFNKKLFVNNAAEFETATMIDIPRLKFLHLRSHLYMFEQNTVKKTISAALADEIKAQIIADTLSPENELLLNSYIRPAECYFALWKMEDKAELKLEYTRLVEELQAYLNTNAATYPLYEASDCYSTLSVIGLNDEASGFFMMGR